MISNVSDLKLALRNAVAGSVIELVPNTIFKSTFSISKCSGNAKDPITIKGNGCTFQGSKKGYGLYLDQCNYWIIEYLTITNSEKGIVLDGSSYCHLNNLTVHDIGVEGIHFRKHSTHNELSESLVFNTGQTEPGFGEGVYIGSAKSNLKKDKSDYNRVINNTIGPNCGAELIDVKEYTTGGIIKGNKFYGAGMSGKNYADSWIDIKGNNYLIQDNYGEDARLDGYQTHEAVKGWGNNNLFDNNICKVNAKGYGFRIDKNTNGNIVKCNNQVFDAKEGLSNIECTK